MKNTHYHCTKFSIVPKSKKTKKPNESDTERMFDQQLNAIAERNRDLTKALKKILSSVNKNS